MWERICFVAIVTLCCQPVIAEAPDVAAIPAAESSAVESQPVRGIAGYWTIDYSTGKVTPGGATLRAETVYDNRTTDSGSAYIPDIPADPNRAVGDSLWMVGDGLLDWLEFSIWNSDTSAGSLSRVDVEIGFYDPNDAILGMIMLDDVIIDPALAPGEVGIFTATDLQSLGINLPYACMYAMFFSDLQGGANGVGQVLYNPPTVGESPDLFYEGPLGDISLGQHNLYFSGDPIANFYFAVGVENPAPLETLWDMGPTHTVIRDSDGTEVWLGYLSGDYDDPAYTHRWAAIPFRIEHADAVITEFQANWWIADTYEADHVNYVIWNRSGLARPESFDEIFTEGLLGPYVEGGRDYRAKPAADFYPFHRYEVNIPIPVGDYYLTIYAEGDGGGTVGRALAWESGCDKQAEDLERDSFWRAQSIPDPGFQDYTAPYSPGPDLTDPEDRWNLAFMFKGTAGGGCPGDIDGDGDTDLSDLAALLASYNKCVGDDGYNPDADFDGSDCVDLSDLASLLADYGCGT